ncbi:MAG: hypothetical protein ISQ14_15880 [Verrucomicrobiae bacterium]|nr:hypothetical protein [Verrucomicrobiae bacterium]
MNPFVGGIRKPRHQLLLRPFESPIEEELARVVDKYLRRDSQLANQVEFSTPNGSFRVDFVISCAQRRIALEANGKKFHDYKRDIWRAALILGNSNIDAIYHLRGRDILFNLESALCAIALIDSTLFSERGILNLKQLSRLAVPRIHSIDGSAAMRVEVRGGRELGHEDDDDRARLLYSINYASKDQPDRCLWRILHQIALRHPGLKVADLIKRYSRTRIPWDPVAEGDYNSVVW